MANGPDLAVPYTEDQKAALYAELASGAESGHDYTARRVRPLSFPSDTSWIFDGHCYALICGRARTDGPRTHILET